jgi:hypothetical protein
MNVVSIDLAHLRGSDFGVAVLRRGSSGATCDLLQFANRDEQIPTPDRVADAAIDIAGRFGASLILLDGRQGWKDPMNGLAHSRLCERRLNTPGKTGLPGHAKPAGYRPFIEFSIRVLDALDARGWRRFDPGDWRPGAPAVVETFPLAAWRSLKLKNLPAKNRARPNDIRLCYESLTNSGLVSSARTIPTHDQLQAIVAGLGGLGVLSGAKGRYLAIGAPPSLLDGVWREGYIVNPVLLGADKLIPCRAPRTLRKRSRMDVPHV